MPPPTPALELLSPSVCPACDTPRSAAQTLLCPACLLAFHPPERRSDVRCVFAYRGTARVLIQRLKFEGRRDGVPVIAARAAPALAAFGADVIVPLPRHVSRIRETGTDPVFTLARAVARAVGLPVDDRALWRTRATVPQQGLTRAERQRNLHGSFAARPRALAGRRAVLFDDVATTGTTLRSARSALRVARARGVVAFAIAATERE